MKLSRKLISITLAIVIALSCFSVCAFALDGTLRYRNVTATFIDSDIASLTQTEADSIHTLDIMNIVGVNIEAALSKLKHLTTIKLKGCGITSISWLSDYTSPLTTVDFSNNGIKDITPLSSFNTITDLNLSYNKIWDLSIFSDIPTVSKLNLSNNLITNVTPLDNSSLTPYNSLNVENNFISDARPLLGCSFVDQSTYRLHINMNYLSVDQINSLKSEFGNNAVLCSNMNSVIPTDPFVAIVDNGISKIVGYFGDPSVKEVVVGTNAYTSKTNTGLATGQITNATQIAEKAFANNVNVESWYISDNINYIDTFAFSRCTTLKRVRLSENQYFTTLKKQTFYACVNLLGVCIPDNVMTVETKAFDLCSRLKYVEFSNKDTSVHSAAFYRCNEDYLTIYVSSTINDTAWQTSTLKSSLDNLLYVSNFTLDRNLAFSNGTLTGAVLTGTTLRVPAGIDSVNFTNSLNCGSYALSKFLMPEGVTDASIDFVGANISSVDILVPQTLTDISDITFPTGTTVTAYTYGNASVTNTNSYTINADYKIAYDVLKKYVKTLSSDTYLTLPALGYDIIGSFSFYGIDLTINDYNSLGNYIKGITLPNGIVEIGTCAFKRLKEMTDFSFNTDGMLKSIGEGAFSYCIYLGNYSDINPSGGITVPTSVTSIGGEAFKYCSRMRSINLGSLGLTTIEAGTFEHCSYLTSIQIPTTVTSIGNKAFMDDVYLTSVNFGTNTVLTEIGDRAFENCMRLPSISIPASVVTLGARVFKDDIYLVTIHFEIDSSLTSIGANAFENCIRLKNDGNLHTGINGECFELPKLVGYIPAHAFSMTNYSPNYSSSFENIILPQNISDEAYIDDEAFEYVDTSSITIYAYCNYDSSMDYYLQDLGFASVVCFGVVNNLDVETGVRANQSQDVNANVDIKNIENKIVAEYLKNSNEEFSIEQLDYYVMYTLSVAVIE